MSAPRITRVRGRRVWDSRGRPTVEAEVELTDGSIGRAIAPAGASTGAGEAIDLRDGGAPFGGMDVMQAVDNVNDTIGPALIGLDAAAQDRVDQQLITLDGTRNKSRLGGNATIAVSMAVAHAAAAARKLPLWRYLLHSSGQGEADDVLMPLPEIQIFGGGAHASARVDLQDFMIMPLGASSFAEALEWTAEVYRAAGKRMADRGRLQGVADEGGFWPAFDSNEEALEELVRAIEDADFVPGDDIGISLDIASTQLFKNGKYHLRLDGVTLDSDEMSDMLIGWLDRFPIVSIEDPLAENDDAGMRNFTEAVGAKVQIIGDDYLVTNAARVEAAVAAGACNAVLIKPNQAGTLSETRAALEAGQAAGWGTIVSARSGETEDVSIVHLAVGWRAGQFKVGSFARSERMAKWNEMLRIEESVGERARFAGRTALPQEAACTEQPRLL
ncbi:MAG: phosphopyruvate hydratase [Alphaproteobacteria bacterium]